MTRASINFQSELEKFKQDLAQDPNLRTRLIEKEHFLWELFYMHSAGDGKKPDSEFYIINKTQVLGSGALGKVYGAYPVRIENELGIKTEKIFQPAVNLNSPPPCIVKKIRSGECFNEQMIMMEVAILAEHYKTDIVQHINTAASDSDSDEYFIFTEYVPGRPLICDRAQWVHPGVATLTLIQRLNLIVQLALQLNGFHHARIKRNAYAHFDIRGDNVLLDISNIEKISISLIDFGNALFFNNDDSAELYIGRRGGMYTYFPPEYLDKKIGLKQDSYALTPLIAVLLGSKTPFSLKEKASGGEGFWRLKNKPVKTAQEIKRFKEKIEAQIKAPYALEDMLDEEVYPPQYPCEVRQLIIDFVSRMQSPVYEKRPDSDELLAFFITILNFFKAYEGDKLDDYKHYLERGQRKDQAILFKLLGKIPPYSSAGLFNPPVVATGAGAEDGARSYYSDKLPLKCGGS